MASTNRTTNNYNRRTSDSRRAAERRSAYTQDYVYGNAVPKRDVRVVTDPRKDPLYRPTTKAQPKKKSRVIGASNMNRLYVSFLTGAVVVMIAMCYQFLTLQTEMSEKVATISTKEVQLAKLKAENDFNLTRMEESVDLEEIREIAIERLGMVEPTKAQIITYSYDDEGYMRQFSDVPSTDGSSILEYFDE